MEKETVGLGMTQPVSVWNRPLSIEPKGFFLNLAKAVVNGTKLELDDFFENLADALQGMDAEDKAGQVAWVLVYNALIRATADLVNDSVDLFEPDEQPPDEYAQVELSGMLNDHLAHCKARIDANFFDHPERFSLLDDFGPGFKDWLEGLGLDAQQAAALVQRLPHRFALALHEEWLRLPERYAPLLKAVDSPFTRAADRQRRWRCYATWLREQVNTRMFAEAFGLQQVYVPLRAYYEESVLEEGARTGEDETDRIALARAELPETRRVVVDLHMHLKDWVANFNSQDTVRVISGGPGSGKSSFTRMLAAEIAEAQGIPVLHIPLHLLDPKADLIQAVAGFATNDRYLQGSPLDASDGEKRLLVIFDGLDELSMQGRTAADVAQQFVDEVLRRADAFAGQGLRRQFLMSGRDLAVQANAGRLRRPRQVLYVLPYLVDEIERKKFQRDPSLLSDKERKRYEEEYKLLAEDHRDRWWQNYGRATGKDFASIPQELRGENLSDITRQPLLNYLLALSHARGQLDFGRETTLNEIYADLLRAIYERQWAGGRRHVFVGELQEQNFDRVLEEIALAVWHGDGRVATEETILERCRASRLDRYLKQVQRSAEEGVMSLLTAFYFRQARDVRGEKTFEFTHKSFGEYLTSRRLVRMMVLAQTQIESQIENPDLGWNERDALKHWAEVCGPTAIDDYVNAFLKNEVARQPADRWMRWQRTVCRLIESAVTHSMPMEKLGLPNFQEMMRQSRNAEEALLAMHAACAVRTREVCEIDWPSTTAFGELLKRLQGQRESKDGPLVMRALVFLPLAGCSLDMSDMCGADLTGADLAHTSVYGARLDDASLAQAELYEAYFQGTYLKSAHLEGADLEGIDLAEANLTAAQLEKAKLARADLQRACLLGAQMVDADLFGANLEGADMRRAVLRGADLEHAFMVGVDLFGAHLPDAVLTLANLRGANMALSNLEGANLERANLRAANLDRANLKGANLKKANLLGAKLAGVNLEGANLDGTYLDKDALGGTL